MQTVSGLAWRILIVIVVGPTKQLKAGQESG